MDEIRDALEKGGIVDITTIGRRTGEERKIETRLHVIDGKFYLTGQPGPRSWYANLIANPDFKIHLKSDIRATVDAKASAVVDPEVRKYIHQIVLSRIDRLEQLQDRIDASPLMLVVLS